MSNTGKSVVSTFDETKSIVLAEVKNGVRGVFAIGKSLKAARDFQEQDIHMDTGLTPYLSMFEELPFDELDEYLPRFPLDLRVKYFSSTKGKLSFPQGFKPKQVKFMLHYANNPSEIYESDFEWSFGV